METSVDLRIGYKASSEQFGPRELLEYAVAAEEHGLDSVTVADHYQPWRHEGGHAFYSLSWLSALGERTSRLSRSTMSTLPARAHTDRLCAPSLCRLYELRGHVLAFRL